MVGTRCSFLFVVRCGWCSGQARGNRSPDRLPARFHNSPPPAHTHWSVHFRYPPGVGRVIHSTADSPVRPLCRPAPEFTRSRGRLESHWPGMRTGPALAGHRRSTLPIGFAQVKKTDPPRDLQVNRSCALGGPEHTATWHYLLHSYTPRTRRVEASSGPISPPVSPGRNRCPDLRDHGRKRTVRIHRPARR